MEGYVVGALIWAYILGGFVFVLVPAIFVGSMSRKSFGEAIFMLSAIWYLGAPSVYFLAFGYGHWQDRRELARANKEYFRLCSESVAETSSRTVQNAEWIKIDAEKGERDDPYPRFFSASGSGGVNRVVTNSDEKDIRYDYSSVLSRMLHKQSALKRLTSCGI